MSEAERDLLLPNADSFLHNKSGGIPMATKYDAIVVGTGQEGPSLAVQLGGAGVREGNIERKRVGGECVKHGCSPTTQRGPEALAGDASPLARGCRARSR